MNNYYYIWYEVFVDGKSAGRGRYWNGYKYKKNAERRAKQMWGDGPFHDPMTGETIEHKWTASQTNPFNTPMTPEEFKQAMADAYHKYYEIECDEELVHGAMDYIICELLRDLGYGEGIDIFDNTPMWYA